MLNQPRKKFFNPETGVAEPATHKVIKRPDFDQMLQKLSCNPESEMSKLCPENEVYFQISQSQKFVTTTKTYNQFRVLLPTEIYDIFYKKVLLYPGIKERLEMESQTTDKSNLNTELQTVGDVTPVDLKGYKVLRIVLPVGLGYDTLISEQLLIDLKKSISEFKPQGGSASV